MERSRRTLASALAALLLSGCETLAYYAQAVGGQMELLARSQPVAEALADPATPAALRERLALTQSIRDFASRELKLPDNGSYRAYADLGRPYAVWNVFAAPEFSLAPVQSCFPVAGCVPYRGFFARADAERHAGRLAEAGNDVYVAGVPAYSTLGRFDDPLLNTFIAFPDAELARLIFHELAHQVAYAKDDATFNESFAVAVEREGMRRWLSATGRAVLLEQWQAGEERRRQAAAGIEGVRDRLAALYRTRLAPDAMRERKRAELETLRAQTPDRFREAAPNNAYLAAWATYTAQVPAFEKLLADEGGDLPRFYERVRKMAIERSSPGPSSAPSR
jgi:predicted aminopeptidase